MQCATMQETVAEALSAEELAARIQDVHVLGIRSKTRVGAAVLAAARRLLAIGCFCIGTNQVDLQARHAAWVPTLHARCSLLVAARHRAGSLSG